MFVDVCLTVEAAGEAAFAGKSVVVIDVLRATSTMVTALANGCRCLRPVLTPEAAFALARAADPGEVLTGGEREGIIIEGFDLGNSPREYTRAKVAGKTVVMTTSNGTRALKKVEGAVRVYLGSLLNAAAVAREVAGQDADLVLFCAGTAGQFSLEDFVAAGLIFNELTLLRPGARGSDLALAARAVAVSCRGDYLGLLTQCTHGGRLRRLGLAEDLAYCARTHVYDLAPVYRDGKIVV